MAREVGAEDISRETG